ncbi:MAG: PQQ-binding-like beta-propeller repeat protein [Verrucomicrobia bacterium]|nr:PQQ-binding-like beta-propeller repeat protein [Verrucomicrobiota bacterium]
MLPPFARNFLLFVLLLTLSVRAAEPSWPQFRGPDGTGVAAGGKAPVHFGPATNLLWKVPLPAGHSSPCIVGNLIFLTGVEKGQLFTFCLDRRDGHLLWRRAAATESVEPAHRTGSPAAPTPATDGERVYVYFGSFGLLCYDLDGNEKWYQKLPPPIVEFGTSTSPILAGDLLILNCDQDMNSYLLAVDKRTGETKWRVERTGFFRGFATPFLWRHDGAEEIIVPGNVWLKSYNLADGKERWRVQGMARVSGASPTAGDGLLFVASWNVGGDESDRLTMPPFDEYLAANDKNKDGKISTAEMPKGPLSSRFSQIDVNKDGVATRVEWETMSGVFAKAENCLMAIRPGGTGDITQTHVLWKQKRSLPYIPSPLHYQGRLYTIRNGGMATCWDAKTGQPLYQDERLGTLGDYYASPVAADGKVYFTSQKGVIVVVQAGDALNILAKNDLGEAIQATPALVEGKLYVRTAGQMMAFGEK